MNKVRQTFEGKTNLFLFPHNDDELFALPLLKVAEECSVETICIFLTSPDSPSLAQQRSSESDTTLSKFNKISLIDDESKKSHDGFLVRDLAHSRKSILDYIANNGITIDNCIFPAFEGGHQDHDAAHLIGASLSSSLELKSLEYFTYRPIGLYKFFSVMSPSKIYRKTKELDRIVFSFREGLDFLGKMKNYPSQKKSLVLLFPFLFLRYLIYRRIEVVVFHSTVRMVNNRVTPLYERRKNFDEIDFLNECREFLREINIKDE